MPRLAVVLDTNAYWSIGEEAFEAFRADERNHSVVAKANYFVATELLSHLASEDDADFEHCIAAITRLGRHCRHWDGSEHRIDFLQLPDAQIARSLFGLTIAPGVATPGEYAALIGKITDDPRPGVLAEHKNSLSELRALVERTEREFAERLWNRVVRTIAPEADSWQSITKSPKRAALLKALEEGEGLDLVAGTIVDRAAAKAQLELTPADRTAAIARARTVFSIPVHHHDLLVRRLIRDGPDMSKPNRANSVWDQEITFSTSIGATIAGTPLILVTGDPVILQAAESAGARRQVWSAQEYRSRLQGRDVYIDAHLG